MTGRSDTTPMMQPWYPTPVFDPEAILMRGAAEAAVAARRLAQARAEYATSGPVHVPAGAVARARQIPQRNRYLCGPAVAETIIRDRGVTGLDGVPVDQDVLAGPDELATAVHGGTRWIHNVMARTLTRWLGTPSYVATEAPSAEDLRAIVAWSLRRSRLVAGEIRQVPGGIHLPGHPVDRELCHWFVIAGYEPATDEVIVVDPAASRHVDWGDRIEPVCRFALVDVAALATHHGVVW